MEMQKYITYKNIELLLFMLFTGFSIALHSLWPGVSVVLGMLAKQALTDYYNYKHDDARIVLSDSLQAELNAIRASHTALEKSTATINTQVQSVNTALSMLNKGGSRYGG